MFGIVAHLNKQSTEKSKSNNHLDKITMRELEVLKLISKQYNSPEIADKLSLGISTVDSHRKSLLRKLKVKNSVGLAIYAVKNKIV